MTDPQQPPPNGPLTGRQTYNLVTDTVGGGPNLRVKDNLIQAAAAGVGILVGAGLGAGFAPDWRVGAGVGAFGGLVAGTFLGGLYLMILRGVRHAQGKHD